MNTFFTEHLWTTASIFWVGEGVFYFRSFRSLLKTNTLDNFVMLPRVLAKKMLYCPKFGERKRF